MTAPFDPILNQICGADQRAFERGHQALIRRWADVGDDARNSDLVTVLRRFGEARGLGPTEISRRVRIIVDAAKLTERQFKELAFSLSNLLPTVRQAVTGSLPAHLRRLVYVPHGQAAAAAGPTNAASAPAGQTAPPPQQAPQECASVILLGTLADHEENRIALERNAFAPLRATTIAQLDEYLDHGVCGVVVARSWWPNIPEAEREGVLIKILSHSSFTWLKFDTHNLPCAAEQFYQVLLAARHAVPTMGECVCHDGWRLTPHDINALERIRAILANSGAIRLCPGDIHEAQARVLVGAAIKHVRQRNPAGTLRLTCVETNLIPGGRSFAKIIRMAPDDGGSPLVAKVDEVGRLKDEMSRFKRYVQRWDASLNPQLHYHAGTSLIIFGLVESPDSPGRPAPTLEETLETMFYCEHWPGSYQGPDENELRELINRAICAIQRINSQANDGAFSKKTFLKCEPYETLRRTGVEWNIGHCDGPDGSVFDFVYAARCRVDAMSDRVIVHGDVQLRNVLVRDGREPHFIDYANCGPGHPCFDLVRLESAILFYCGRMNGDERELAPVLLDVLRGRSEGYIAQHHPLFYTSRTNRLAIYGCIACRAAAVGLVTNLGGDEDDYVAMKYVIACQSLFIIHLQAGVIRAQLSALGAFMRTRPGWERQPRPMADTGTGDIVEDPSQRPTAHEE